MIEFLRNLINIKSISPKDMGCFDLIEAELKQLNFQCERINYSNVENLYASYGKNGKLFCFLGHTDIVPPGPEEEWTYPPFAGEIDGDLMYGRGTADMKGSIAAFIEALKDFLKQSSKNINFRIAILLTSNEEGVSKDGFIDKIIEDMISNGQNIDFCLVGEPTSLTRVGDNIKLGRRGSLSGNLKILGKQGHIAYPEKLENPIFSSAKLIKILESTLWDDGNDIFQPTSFQISNINSGTGVKNIIPGELSMEFNFRYSPKSNYESLIFEFEKILKEANLKYQINWEKNGEPYHTKSAFFKNIVINSIKDINGSEPNINTKGGTSDGRFVAKMDSEIIELGLVNKTIHQIDEVISINELNLLKQMYENILIKLDQSL
ncbi:MAG: succinyl-diaminopimelate desuccinylase [Gammaproteobacteria bacterium]|nr:succinyl-diaminopimelate desuccinylase [Gammaproteobacteria bacterium]|tara:strand:+ start:3354 stop:4484 length:1131 start_codon:yes stop_codon:yes gene_type:complete